MRERELTDERWHQVHTKKLADDDDGAGGACCAPVVPAASAWLGFGTSTCGCDGGGGGVKALGVVEGAGDVEADTTREPMELATIGPPIGMAEVASASVYCDRNSMKRFEVEASAPACCVTAMAAEEADGEAEASAGELEEDGNDEDEEGGRVLNSCNAPGNEVASSASPVETGGSLARTKSTSLSVAGEKIDCAAPGSECNRGAAGAIMALRVFLLVFLRVFLGTSSSAITGTGVAAVALAEDGDGTAVSLCTTAAGITIDGEPLVLPSESFESSRNSSGVAGEVRSFDGGVLPMLAESLSLSRCGSSARTTPVDSLSLAVALPFASGTTASIAGATAAAGGA